MTKKKKIIIIIIGILILAAGALVAYKILNPQEAKQKTIKSLDTIKGFDYILEDRDKDIYAQEFKILKKNLEGSEINYEEYAKSIAKMFIIDLYTIDNKTNKYDVGGCEFVHPDALENYKLNVKDTIYKYVSDNSNNDRKQELPEISKVTVDNFEETTYKIGEEETSAYKVDLSFEYKEDLEYDESAILYIVKKDKYLYVVEKIEGNTNGAEDVNK